jgi:hypothetical protein
MINAEKIDEITSRIANNFNPDKIILLVLMHLAIKMMIVT